MAAMATVSPINDNNVRNGRVNKFRSEKWSNGVINFRAQWNSYEEIGRAAVRNGLTVRIPPPAVNRMRRIAQCNPLQFRNPL